MTNKEKEKIYKPGLEGIPVCRSEISYIDGVKGILQYRGYRIETLAENSTFEETAYLLLNGKLPNSSELGSFCWDLEQHRKIKFKLIDILKCLPEDGHPMEAMMAAVAALGMYHPAKNVQDKEQTHLACVRLLAKIPSIIATFHRIRTKQEPVLPKEELNTAANFLYMLTGKVPSEKAAKMLDVCFILHAEHTLNASTFSARVTGSTLTDPYSVISAAIATLRGPLHGGANERVIEMLHQIGSPDRVRPWLEEKIAKKEKIMGLGHRVYKTKDPRATILQEIASDLFDDKEDQLLNIAEELEKVANEKLASKGIYPNVDFYSGLVYQRLGIPHDLYTPLFATSRTAGWLAHWLEQLKDNRIFRPTQIYTGPHELKYVPEDKR